MSAISASAVGFRVLFRRPLIAIAEIAWRWTFAAAGWILGLLFLIEYFDSLPVTRLDRLLLYTGQPFLVARAIRRIFHGSSFRFIEAAIILGLGLTIAWIVLASLGRVAVLRSVCEELELPANSPRALRSLLSLNFLRAGVVLATKIAAIGSVLLTSSLWASTHMTVGAALRLQFLVWFLLWITWAVLNWLLSVASIFVVAHGKDSMTAIGEVVSLVRDRTARVLAASALFGVAHVIALAAEWFLLLSLLPFAVTGPIALVLIWAAVFAYCCLADLLYTGRLASYVFLAAGGDQLPSWIPRRPAPPMPIPPQPSSIDKDELILSDVPAPA